MPSEAGIITSSLSTSLKSTCVILIYNLALAKSEALVNIYSLLKQNIINRVMLTKRRRQPKQQRKKVYLAKQKTLHVQHTFFIFLCRCFVWRQRGTSRNFLGTRFMKEMLFAVLFTFLSLPLLFTLVAASRFSFSHSRCKIFMLFFKRNWSPLSLYLWL